MWTYQFNLGMSCRFCITEVPPAYFVIKCFAFSPLVCWEHVCFVCQLQVGILIKSWFSPVGTFVAVH